MPNPHDPKYQKIVGHLEFAGFARALFKTSPGLCLIIKGNFIPLGEIIQNDADYLGLNVSVDPRPNLLDPNAQISLIGISKPNPINTIVADEDAVALVDRILDEFEDEEEHPK